MVTVKRSQKCQLFQKEMKANAGFKRQVILIAVTLHLILTGQGQNPPVTSHHSIVCQQEDSLSNWHLYSVLIISPQTLQFRGRSQLGHALGFVDQMMVDQQQQEDWSQGRVSAELQTESEIESRRALLLPH